jgi:hypothetical protein
VGKKRPTTEEKLMAAAEKARRGEFLAKETGPASKPVSLHPLSLEQAVSGLLKVKPEPRDRKAKR